VSVIFSSYKTRSELKYSCLPLISYANDNSSNSYIYMNRKIFCIPNAKVTLCLKMQNQIKPMYHLFLVCALFNHTFKVEDHLQQRLIIKSALCSMYNYEFIGFSIVM